MKKGTMWAAIALTMMAATALSGCSLDSDSQDPVLIIDPVEPPTSMELTRGEQELVNQSNAFAFNESFVLLIMRESELHLVDRANNHV